VPALSALSREFHFLTAVGMNELLYLVGFALIGMRGCSRLVGYLCVHDTMLVLSVLS